MHTTRYEKKVPGHHIQLDVKFLSFKAKSGATIKRFQYTAIDDATRIRALKIYNKHNQANAIDFVDYVIEKFPFRIQMIRTDRGHEFQAKFHWHVEDRGIRHVYIKPRSPQLNGKVERSHRSDQEEFYQLLSYKDDVDLEAKLADWERFYNLARPHGAHNGKTPLRGSQRPSLIPLTCLDDSLSSQVLLWIVACSIGAIYARPEARATVMVAIGIVYTLLAVLEFWRGRGDDIWRWPIMVLLLAHAAAIPIHIPLVGGIDPS